MTVLASYAPKPWQESLLVYGGRLLLAWLVVRMIFWALLANAFGLHGW
jgi:hypothetical protein